MKLSEFLALKEISQARFGEMVGVEQAAISRYVAGERMPRPEHLLRIREVTKGAVTADDFLLSAAE